MTKPGPTPADCKTGDRIRVRRKALGITQSDLAEALGLTFQQVQKYERGVNRVSSQVLVAIAKKLETTVNFLLGLEDGDANLSPVEAARRDFIHRDEGAKVVDVLVGLSDRELRFILYMAERIALLSDDRPEDAEVEEALRLRAVG